MESLNYKYNKIVNKRSAALYEIDIFASKTSLYNLEYDKIISSNLTEKEKQELIKIHNNKYNENK